MLYDRSPEVVLEGPAGTGKSRALLEKGYICVQKYPGARILLTRKTRESMSESVLVTFERHVLPEGDPLLDGASRASRSIYPLANGSEIIVAGLLSNGRDQKAKIMSTEYDMILIFEATELSEHEFEQLTTRLRNGVMPYQQLIADCNPDIPLHWLHQRTDRGAAQIHFSRHEDNPALFDAQRGTWTPRGAAYIATLDRLTGVRYARLRLGKRAIAEGGVYNYDRAVHRIDEMPRGWEAWRKIRAIDFGYTNPFVCQWWAIDPDGRMYLYREIYMSGRTVKRHAEQINELSEGEKYEATVADHDAEDRATLEENGITTTAAIKAISRGIQKVQERLANAGDGKPRIYVLAGATVETDEHMAEAKKPVSTDQEFDGYVYPKGVDNKPNKEAPVDLDNHGMDTMRYAVAYEDLRPALQVF